MEPTDFTPQLNALAALADPVRRRLYEVVLRSSEPVSRDQAARGAGVSRALAAFHLDRLVESGLLEASFRRLTARSGPGAGRPSKHYSRSALQVDVSLPERRYEWAAQVLSRALTDARWEDPDSALRRSAHERGEAIGHAIAEQQARAGSQRRAKSPDEAGAGSRELRETREALASCGFEPVTSEAGEVLLRNCPFDRLREGNRDLICGMNLSLIEGVIAGLGVEGVTAALEPRPGHCCVVLRSGSPG